MHVHNSRSYAIDGETSFGACVSLRRCVLLYLEPLLMTAIDYGLVWRSAIITSRSDAASLSPCASESLAAGV